MLLASALFAEAAAPTPWTVQPAIQASTVKKLSMPSFKPPVFTVDMDEPAATRWANVTAHYKADMPAVIAYFDHFIPPWAVPLVEAVAGSIHSYFHKYGEEMEAIALGLGVNTGTVVLINLVMQIEAVGLNCSNWNDTAPTRPGDPGCMDVDPDQKWCYCHQAAAAGAVFPPSGQLEFGRHAATDGPGLCTSVVAQDTYGHIIHGRNLDWNLPPALRKLMIDIDFLKDGKKLFRGTGAVGAVGVFNGMRYGGVAGGGWSASIDARGKGGSLWGNLLQALLEHSMTPSQHLRDVLETARDYPSAVAGLSSTPQIDENYFIVAGSSAGQGAVISRGRDKVHGGAYSITRAQ